MAPEQAESRRADIGAATDVYGLGAILYELLTGRPPFPGEGAHATLRRVVAENPESPRRLRPGLSRDLETVCLKCLAKDPARRYATASALGDDLEAWLEHRPVAARPATARARLAKWVRRRPGAAALVAVSVLTLLAALAGSLWHSWTLGLALHDREQALEESDRLRKEGLERENRLRDHLYVPDMRLAMELWEAGDFTRVRELLDRHRPGEGEDRRGFEWYWLWGLAHPEKARFRAHQGGLLCAAVSPDDRFLVTGDRKGTLKVWDLATLNEVCALIGHTDEVQRAVFARDGRTLATCGKDRTIRLWDVATWQPAGRLSGTHEMTVTSVAFSPDGALLASCDRARRIAVWELPRARLRRTWLAHADVVHDVGFTPDGRTLLSVGKDDSARAWNVADGRELARFSRERSFPLRLSLSPDGRMLAMAGYTHLIYLWDWADSAAPVELPAAEQVRCLAFSRRSDVLATGHDDGALTVWALRPGNTGLMQYRAVHVASGPLREVAFAHKGATLVAAAEDGTVSLWNLGGILGWEPVTTEPTLIHHIAVSYDGRRAAWCTDSWCVLWDLTSQKELWRRQMAGRPDVVVFEPSGRTVAATCLEELCVFDVATGRTTLKRRTADIQEPFLDVAFSPSGARLATTHNQGTVRVWEYPSGKLLAGWHAHDDSCFRLAFSRDERTLAVSSMDHTISLWDTRTFERKAVLRGHSDRPESLALTPDDRTLISGGLDGSVKAWDLASGKEVRTLSWSRFPASRMAVAPDGRTLAWLGADRVSGADAVRLLHLATGQELFTFAPGGLRFMSVAFSPDGRTLLAGTKPSGPRGPCPVLLFRSAPPGP
jgi:WD40 repeat protein